MCQPTSSVNGKNRPKILSFLHLPLVSQGKGKRWQTYLFCEKCHQFNINQLPLISIVSHLLNLLRSEPKVSSRLQMSTRGKPVASAGGFFTDQTPFLLMNQQC